MTLLLALAWTFAMGFLLIQMLDRELSLAVRLPLAAGLGAGAVSCCFFLSLESGLPALLFESLLFAGAGAVSWKRGWRSGASPVEDGAPRWLRQSIAVALSMLLALDAFAFFQSVSENPHGEWDAWAIWNLHARFLFTPFWRDLFSPAIQWTHPDYPLLLSGFIARIWTILGERDPAAPATAAFLFTFATIALLGGAVASLKGRTQGWLAALVLAATPYYVARGASEYADTPVSFFVLAAVALTTLQDRVFPCRRGLSVLAGLCACMAAWTKNEGLLLLAVLLPVRACGMWRSRGPRAAAQHLALIAAGCAPVLALLLLFKFTLATANANLGGRSLPQLMHLLAAPDRWRVVLLEMGKGIVGFGGLRAALVPLLAVYVAWTGIDRACDRRGVLAGFAVIALMLAGYCAVFLVSPGEIHWQTENAVGRLLLQLWPATVFLVFLLARRIDESTATGNAGAATASQT